MNLAAISHRSVSPDAYALNENEIVINLQTGKDITAVGNYVTISFDEGILKTIEWLKTL